MSDMDRREAEMDGFLRRSMAGPVPRLSPEFHQMLSHELHRRSQFANRFRGGLLAGYGTVSAAVSIVVMRSQELSWAVIAAMTLGALATIGLLRPLKSVAARANSIRPF